VRRQVHLAVRVAVQDSRSLVVEVENSLFVGLVFKERFVGTHHLGVLPKTTADPAAQVDDALHPFGGKEGMAEYLFRCLPDPVNAPGPLDQPDDCPGKVVVHHDGAVLKVLSLAQYVGRNQDPQLALR